MGSRTRKTTTPIEGAALGRVAATAHTRPESATAASGFASRAAAALYPVVPAWIQWTYERSSAETARFFYQLCYPQLDDNGEVVGGWTTFEGFWTRDRIFWTEKEARKAARARLRGGRGVIAAHSPELPDDAEFFTAIPSATGSK